MAQAPRAYVEAAERYGYLAEGEAHRYGVRNGATLLLKIASGESHFKMGAVSSAGARGATQFMPGTRTTYIHRYGIDPWKSPDEAIHAAAIFMHTEGLAKYNPGDPSYIPYILGQQVGSAGSAQSPPARVSGSGSSSSGPGGLSGTLMHVGLTAVLVLGGGALVALGTTRLVGAGKRSA